ncbi:MAG: alpha/beta fold hydrolase [Thermoplasmata archaeon]|nr:alpha/beta fold hydrolase [Thermoplasmata archaeon]
MAMEAGAIRFSTDSGDGTPVLLLHGMGGDHTVWAPVLGPLSAEHRVLAVDLRGHGRSPTPDGSTFSFDEMTADVTTFAEEKQLGKFHLVGLSAGGFVALKYALDSPERLRSLTLFGAAAHTDAHMRAVLDRWAELHHLGNLDEYASRMAKDLFSPDWLENHLDFYDEFCATMKARDARAAGQWGSSIRTFDVRRMLGRIALPTLVVQGMDDRLVDPSHARILRQAIPGAEMRLLPYAGHLVPTEKPDEVAQILKDWFRKVDGGASA